MMRIKHISQVLTNEKGIKLYKGEVWRGSFFAGLASVWKKLLKRIVVEHDSDVHTFRLISNCYFFPEDYIDISMEVVPQVGQKITIKEIEAIFIVIRKSDQAREFELLKKEEGLEHSSTVIAREYLKERYPYLMYPSDKAYNSCQLLEVIDVISVYN